MALAIFVFFLFILLFAGLGCLGLVVGLGLRSVVRRVAKEGRITEGRVRGTRTIMRGIKNRQRHYYATIAYQMEGQSYEQDLRISRKHYQLWAKGTPVHLQYHPSAPKVPFLLEDRTEQQMPFAYLLGAGILFAAAVAMLILMILVLLGALH